MNCPQSLSLNSTTPRDLTTTGLGFAHPGMLKPTSVALNCPKKRPFGPTLQLSLQQPWWGCCKVLIRGLADFERDATRGHSGEACTRCYRFSVHGWS